MEWAAAEGEDEEEWECVACGKSFRSEAAWDSHERSRKHLKAVETLKREMEQENEELALEGDIVEETAAKAESTGSGLDQDEVEESVSAGSEELPISNVDQEEPDAVPAPENKAQVPTMNARSVRRKTKNLPREPSPEIIPNSRKSSRNQHISLDPLIDGNSDDGDSLRYPRSSFNEASMQERQGPSKKDKRRAREAAKKARASGLPAETLVVGLTDCFRVAALTFKNRYVMDVKLGLIAEASSSRIYVMYPVTHFPLLNLLVLQVAVARNKQTNA